MQSRGLPLHILAWCAALLPFLTDHVSYLIAASYGHVEWCVPYWESCTSISATGRQLPEKLWFKLGMMPAAMITGLLWWSLRQWLLQTSVQGRRRSLNAMATLGVIAALFLMVYTVALGEEGDAYQQIRHSGIILSFSLTYMAQLLFTHQVGVMAKSSGDEWAARWHRRLFGLVALLLATGILSVILDAMMGTDYDDIEDAFEWVLALMLNLYFAATAILISHYKVRIATL